MQENAKDWGALKLHSIGMGGVVNPKIHAPRQMCYHVKFGSLQKRMYA